MLTLTAIPKPNTYRYQQNADTLYKLQKANALLIEAESRITHYKACIQHPHETWGRRIVSWYERELPKTEAARMRIARYFTVLSQRLQA